MKKFSITLTVLISLCCFILTLGQYLPLEFSTDHSKTVFYTSLLFLLPICIAIKIFMKFHQNSKNYFINILTSLLLGFIAFLVLGFLMLGKVMCVYSINRVLVQKQVTNPTKIIERNCNCGAWDSDMTKYEYVKIVPITNFINYVTTIDTATLDKPNWVYYYP